MAARRAGLRLTTINWHLTADEAGYIIDDCDATAFVADARFADAAAGAAELAPRLARAGRRWEVRSPVSRIGKTCWASSRATRSTIRVVGRTMLYTSGTTGRPKGVHRPSDPRGDLDVGLLTQYDPDAHVHLCTGPLYHAAPLAFSWSAPAAVGVPIVLMDGWSAEETLRLVEQHRDHAHAHGSHDVPPAALAARAT